MLERRRIFIGSSSEALGVAKLVGEAIQRAGMEPVLWETIFPAGEITLEGIEQLPNSVDGVVLLATPDLVCFRAKNRFHAPVANIVFEYGYLSGRLSRKRVAICSFEGADIPSDLKGLTVVQAGSYGNGDQLPNETETALQRWVKELAPLAAGIPPMRRVHGYSGIWHVQNKFSIWHAIELGENDLVWWEGRTLIRLRDDGEEGYGTQIGQLKVKLGQYRATWDVANEVIRAIADKDGGLNMRVKVCARSRVDETGTPPDDRACEALPSTEWELVLKPVPSAPLKLEGTHQYSVAGQTYSRALKYYTYVDV